MVFFCLYVLQRYEVHGSKMNTGDFYTGAESHNTLCRSDFPCLKSHHQSKQKSFHLHYSNSSPGQNSSMVYEDSAGETTIYNRNQGYKLSNMHDTVVNSVLNHHDHHGGRITSERIKPLLHDYDNSRPKIVQNSVYLSKHSNLILGSSNSLDAVERVPSTMMTKVLLLLYVLYLFLLIHCLLLTVFGLKLNHIITFL